MKLKIKKLPKHLATSYQCASKRKTIEYRDDLNRLHKSLRHEVVKTNGYRMQPDDTYNTYWCYMVVMI